MDCQICCEKINKSTRIPVNCNYCDYSICRSCFQRYLLESSIDPHCMNCKKIFTRDFLTSNCTSVFITKTYKVHRENVLLDREKCMLPATQPYVVIEKQKEKIYADIRKIEKYKSDLQVLINASNEQIRGLYHQSSTLNADTVTGQNTEAKKFIRKCPMSECRGFLSSRWKCGTCETNICNKCNERKDPDIEHTCDPANVETMELLNKDTKPCPSCGTMISKISGCDQMWCPDCQTAFSWNRGTIETGVVHNPHYYDFQRRANGGVAPRNAGDIPCGGLPDGYTFRRQISTLRLDPVNMTKLMNVMQSINHIQQVELRNYRQDDQTLINRSLRVDYLLNRISEDALKHTLQQNEKAQQKKRDFSNIYQMFCDVGSDIFRQISANRQANVEYIDQQLVIIQNLVEYFNDNLKNIGKVYNCVYPGITREYSRAHNYETYLKKNK